MCLLALWKTYHEFQSISLSNWLWEFLTEEFDVLTYLFQKQEVPSWFSVWSFCSVSATFMEEGAIYLERSQQTSDCNCFPCQKHKSSAEALTAVSCHGERSIFKFINFFFVFSILMLSPSHEYFSSCTFQLYNFNTVNFYTFFWWELCFLIHLDCVYFYLLEHSYNSFKNLCGIIARIAYPISICSLCFPMRNCHIFFVLCTLSVF